MDINIDRASHSSLAREIAGSRRSCAGASLLLSLLAGCALPPAQPDSAAQSLQPAAEANLAHSQLATLVYQDLLLKLERGAADEAHAELCHWLLDEALFLLAAVEELPAVYHARTGRVLGQLREQPPGCGGLQALEGRIDQALDRLAGSETGHE